jgi:hypothetical protein
MFKLFTKKSKFTVILEYKNGSSREIQVFAKNRIDAKQQIGYANLHDMKHVEVIPA